MSACQQSVDAMLKACTRVKTMLTPLAESSRMVGSAGCAASPVLAAAAYDFKAWGNSWPASWSAGLPLEQRLSPDRQIVWV